MVRSVAGSEDQGAPGVADPAEIGAQVEEGERESAQPLDLAAMESRLYGAMSTAMATMAADLQKQMHAMMMETRSNRKSQDGKSTGDTAGPTEGDGAATGAPASCAAGTDHAGTRAPARSSVTNVQEPVRRSAQEFAVA